MTIILMHASNFYSSIKYLWNDYYVLRSVLYADINREVMLWGLRSTLQNCSLSSRLLIQTHLYSNFKLLSVKSERKDITKFDAITIDAWELYKTACSISTFAKNDRYIHKILYVKQSL